MGTSRINLTFRFGSMLALPHNLPAQTPKKRHPVLFGKICYLPLQAGHFRVGRAAQHGQMQRDEPEMHLIIIQQPAVRIQAEKRTGATVVAAVPPGAPPGHGPKAAQQFVVHVVLKGGQLRESRGGELQPSRAAN